MLSVGDKDASRGGPILKKFLSSHSVHYIIMSCYESPWELCEGPAGTGAGEMSHV